MNGVPATVTEQPLSASVPLAEGSNTLTVRAVDTLGHETTATVGVSLDTTAPVVTLTAPADGARLRSTPVTVTGTVDAARTSPRSP